MPDWPTSFGHSPISYRYFEVPLMGGVLYEHGHRMVAEFIGILTIILAIWTWRADRRGWMRKLGVAALATVIVQGIFGGVTVLLGLPAAVSSVHAALGQSFFCLMVAIALLTGERWIGQEPEVREDSQRPPLPALAWMAVAAIFVQLVLGAMFRHHGMKLLPHLIIAGVVTFLVLWTITRTLSRYREFAQLRRPATMLLLLLFVQLALGFAAYMTRVVWGPESITPQPVMVAATVTHVSVGALLLATAVVLAIQASRHVPVLARHRIERVRKAVTA